MTEVTEGPKRVKEDSSASTKADDRSSFLSLNETASQETIGIKINQTVAEDSFPEQGVEDNIPSHSVDIDVKTLKEQTGTDFLGVAF